MGKHEFQPKEWVLVRDGEGENWRLDIFSHFIDGGIFPYICVGNRFSECSPYEGNEALLGPTDAPKEKPKEEFKFGDKVEWRNIDGKWNKGFFILDDGTACPYMIYDPEDNDTFYVDKEDIRRA